MKETELTIYKKQDLKGGLVRINGFEYVAFTETGSAYFETHAGAHKWLVNQGYTMVG